MPGRVAKFCLRAASIASFASGRFIVCYSARDDCTAALDQFPIPAAITARHDSKLNSSVAAWIGWTSAGATNPNFVVELPRLPKRSKKLAGGHFWGLTTLCARLGPEDLHGTSGNYCVKWVGVSCHCFMPMELQPLVCVKFRLTLPSLVNELTTIFVHW